MSLFWERDHNASGSVPPPRSKPPKSPKKGKLCIAIAPFAAWPALLALANAIGQSLS